jgi:hypothetical protein
MLVTILYLVHYFHYVGGELCANADKVRHRVEMRLASGVVFVETLGFYTLVPHINRQCYVMFKYVCVFVCVCVCVCVCVYVFIVVTGVKCTHSVLVYELIVLSTIYPYQLYRCHIYWMLMVGRG